MGHKYCRLILQVVFFGGKKNMMESEGGGKMLKSERMSLSILDEISDLRDRI